MSGHRFTHKKRRAQIAPAELTEDSSEVDVMAQELTQLRLFRDALLTPLAVTGTFNLQLDAEKQRLPLARAMAGFPRGVEARPNNLPEDRAASRPWVNPRLIRRPS